MDAFDLLSRFRVIPVVVIDDPAHAVPLAECLLAAGIGVIEVTLRTEAALDAIEAIATGVPQMLVGAGSIRRTQQLQLVANAGARFAISPGATKALVTAAGEMSMPFVPGAATPSEILGLLEQGYRLQKFFPAEAAGGIPLLRAISSPIPEASFMPTGGISAALAADYLALPNVCGVGGSWIAPPDLIKAEDFEEIARLAQQAILL